MFQAAPKLLTMFYQAHLTHSLTQIGAQPPFFIFDKLKRVYTEPGRYYHTDKHIADCLTLFQALRHQANHTAEVAIALWFHDAIFDTRRQDNEEQSAEWASNFLKAAKVKQASIDRIAQLIMVTKTHNPHDADTALMTDIDLSILGEQPHLFEQYDADIRREYSWVPEQQFRQGRVQVLKGFLERENIYTTASFSGQYEEQARTNLRRKIEQLSSGLLP